MTQVTVRKVYSKARPNIVQAFEVSRSFDKEISSTAIICNAPRPLIGETTWDDYNDENLGFIHGRHYSAIDLEKGDDFDRKIARQWLERNVSLDCRVLEFITPEEFEAELQAFQVKLEAEYSDLDEIERADLEDLFFLQENIFEYKKEI